MDDRSGKGKFAVSSGPVNRRTAAPAQRTDRAPSIVTARLQARLTKHRLGTPLVQRLTSGSAMPGARPATSRTVVLQAMACTVGATVVFLGAIQAAWGVVAAGMVMLIGAATWTCVQWRNRQRQDSSGLAMTAWIAPSDLERLDTLLEQLAQASEPATIDVLCQLKDRLSRCVRLVGEHPDLAAPEDALFVRETVRRYLPDSLQATLNIPPQDRSSQIIDGGKTATALLHEQLALLETQLRTHEARLAPLAGEALLRQQRFLAAKAQPAPPRH